MTHKKNRYTLSAWYLVDVVKKSCLGSRLVSSVALLKYHVSEYRWIVGEKWTAVQVDRNKVAID